MIEPGKEYEYVGPDKSGLKRGDILKVTDDAPLFPVTHVVAAAANGSLYELHRDLLSRHREDKP